MGEGPVPPAKSNVLVTAAVQPGSLTMKVNLEILIRNLTAQAGNSWLSPTNDPWEILMEVLRGEGVDCNPPHGLAINHQTGEITTQNTPEQLEIFRQVIDQLNRADGKCALPLRLSSFHRPPVLIDAQCYWLSTTELQQLVSGLPSYGSHTGDAQNWTIAPELREEMNRRIALLGVTPFSRPRIQTSHGIEARLYCGNGTNGLELACRPLVIPGGITMDYRTELVGDPSGKDQTLNGTNRHLSFGFAPVENQGGIMLQEAGLKTMEKHLVMLLNLQVLTNEPAVGESSGILTNANFRQMARALEQRSGVEFLKEPEPQLVSRTGRGINGMTMTNYSVSLSNANPSGSIRPPASVSYEYGLPYHDDLVRDGQLLYEMGQLAEAEVKFKAALTADSNNGTAKYYLGLMKTNWVVPKAITYTGSGRQEIVKRLHEIRLDHVEYDGVHLADVLRDLSQQTRTNDPEKKGLNFVINPNPDKTGLIDPATGLPVAQTTEASSTEAVGLGSFVIKIPRLNDVRLGDVLDAVVKGASEPIRYSIQDFAVVFSAGKPLPPLYARTFTVDTNSFLTALRKVTRMQTNSVPALARSYFSTLGVNWESPAGKAIFYSDSRGQLYVKETVSDLDKIEHAISDQLPPTPQIHIKARFVAVIQEDSKTAGFDWYLGQFNANNAVVGVGGSSSPPAVAVSASNPRGIFPGNTNSGPDGLHNSAPAITSLTGILAATNSRVVIHALEQRGKSEVLGEPEVTTASGRRTIMKATTTISVITNFTYQETATNSGIIPQFENAEFGPVLDSTASVLSDGYTIDLNIQASYSEFLGYYKTTNTTAFYTKNGKKVNVPSSFPRIEVRQTSTHMKVPDGQTVVLGGMIIPSIRTTKDKVPLLGNLPVVGRLFQSQSKTEIKKNLMIFVTATIVDPAGNRVHSDDDLPFAQKGVPPQPAQFNNGNSNGH
jgi:type II secretory pathway component GspD/PulD (secretin)